MRRTILMATIGLFLALPANAGSLGSVMQQYEGRNPTGYAYLWCADMVNFALKRLGLPTSGGRNTESFYRYGTPAPRGAIGSIATSRRHVGVVVPGNCPKGQVNIVSGNSAGKRGRRVVATYCQPISRYSHYRYPSGGRYASASPMAAFFNHQ